MRYMNTHACSAGAQCENDWSTMHGTMLNILSSIKVGGQNNQNVGEEMDCTALFIAVIESSRGCELTTNTIMSHFPSFIKQCQKVCCKKSLRSLWLFLTTHTGIGLTIATNMKPRQMLVNTFFCVCVTL